MLSDFLGGYFLVWILIYLGTLILQVSLHKFVKRQTRRGQYLLFSSFALIDITLYFFGTKMQHNYIAILMKVDFLLAVGKFYVEYMAFIVFMIVIWQRFII